MQNKTVLTKRFYLSAMHSLGNPDLSPEENKKIFGPCYRLHGHDYRIDVSVTGLADNVAGAIDKKWGLVVDRDALTLAVNESLIKPFNKTNLNHAFGNTSGELLSWEFFEILDQALPETIQLVSVALIETHRNTFVAAAGQ